MNRSDDFQRAVVLAKTAAKQRYDRLVAKAMAAYEAGLFDAEKLYREEIEAIDRMRDSAMSLVFGEGAGAEAPVPVRPPTWKDAVLRALEMGPSEGMHVKDIFAAVEAMGVKTKGAKTSEDPLRMVDEALYRLGDRVERVGRRTWALSLKGSQETVK